MDDLPVDFPAVPTHLFDPAPEFAVLREERPICRLRYPDGNLGWLVSSHALARTVLADERFSVRGPHVRPVARTLDNAAALRAEFPQIFALSLLSVDPPEHTRLRRLQAGYFTVRRLNEYRPRIGHVVADCLDAIEQAGQPVDLVETFTNRVHTLTVCEFLGLPHADLNRLVRRPTVMRDREASAAEAVAATREFFDYLREVIEKKRAGPTDGDMLSDLATRGVPIDELVAIAEGMTGTATPHTFALSTFALLNPRERWETLCRDPSLIEAAVDELLRYITVFQHGAVRMALEDVELQEGILIRAGERVTVSMAAANRDPARFGDPDRLDFSRDARGHLAFGHGRHICIGLNLARLEIQVGLAGLMQRFPTLRLAVPVEEIPLYSGEHNIYGAHRLPVTW